MVQTIKTLATLADLGVLAVTFYVVLRLTPHASCFPPSSSSAPREPIAAHKSSSTLIPPLCIIWASRRGTSSRTVARRSSGGRPSRNLSTTRSIKRLALLCAHLSQHPLHDRKYQISPLIGAHLCQGALNHIIDDFQVGFLSGASRDRVRSQVCPTIRHFAEKCAKAPSRL